MAHHWGDTVHQVESGDLAEELEIVARKQKEEGQSSALFFFFLFIQSGIPACGLALPTFKVAFFPLFLTCPGIALTHTHSKVCFQMALNPIKPMVKTGCHSLFHPVVNPDIDFSNVRSERACSDYLRIYQLQIYHQQ